MKTAEASLQHSDIIGTVTHGRMGLGCITRSMWKIANQSERREMVQREVQHVEEEMQQARTAALRKQGRWLNWEGTKAKRLTWDEIGTMETNRMSFVLKSIYDVFPSPTNLVSWGLSENPACKLCSKPEILEHVLSSSREKVTDGRYRWRPQKMRFLQKLQNAWRQRGGERSKSSQRHQENRVCQNW